ncbi:MAG: 30S ribosomal protein S27e [Thermoplasmata archaeon]|nr:30S ribosomal protein S27e [Thermoplasmata archaeon]
MQEVGSRFIRVRCKDCGNEQVLFNKCSTKIFCHICSSILAEPKGGKAEVKGEILEELE